MSSFQMGPLSLNVKSYADDVSKDFYEANWLNIDVKCATDEGDVAFRSFGWARATILSGQS